MKKELKPIPQMTEVGMSAAPAESATVRMCSDKMHDGTPCPNRTFGGESKCYPHFLGLAQTPGGLVILPGWLQKWENQ